MKRAEAEGAVFGRPATLDADQRDAGRAGLADGVSVSELAKRHGTSRQTIMRVRDAAPPGLENRTQPRRRAPSGSSPLLQAARLWEKTSCKGTRYMQGSLGGVKLVILPNRGYVEGDSANGHSHNLFFQNGLSTQPRPAERAPAAEPRERACKADRLGRQLDDDRVPFLEARPYERV